MVFSILIQILIENSESKRNSVSTLGTSRCAIFLMRKRELLALLTLSS